MFKTLSLNGSPPRPPPPRPRRDLRLNHDLLDRRSAGQAPRCRDHRRGRDRRPDRRLCHRRGEHCPPPPHGGGRLRPGPSWLDRAPPRRLHARWRSDPPSASASASAERSTLPTSVRSRRSSKERRLSRVGKHSARFEPLFFRRSDSSAIRSAPVCRAAVRPDPVRCSWRPRRKRKKRAIRPCASSHIIRPVLRHSPPIAGRKDGATRTRKTAIMFKMISTKPPPSPCRDCAFTMTFLVPPEKRRQAPRRRDHRRSRDRQPDRRLGHRSRCRAALCRGGLCSCPPLLA